MAIARLANILFTLDTHWVSLMIMLTFLLVMMLVLVIMLMLVKMKMKMEENIIAIGITLTVSKLMQKKATQKSSIGQSLKSTQWFIWINKMQTMIYNSWKQFYLDINTFYLYNWDISICFLLAVQTSRKLLYPPSLSRYEGGEVWRRYEGGEHQEDKETPHVWGYRAKLCLSQLFSSKKPTGQMCETVQPDSDLIAVSTSIALLSTNTYFRYATPMLMNL